MVKSYKPRSNSDHPTKRLVADVVKHAISDGVPTEEITAVVETVLMEAQDQDQGKLFEVEPTIYTELPFGLIPVKEAAEKYDLKVSSIHAWIQRGHLIEKGRLRHPGKGGGKVLINEMDLVSLIKNPPKAGRPSKHSTV